ncbi:MAG TPA: PilN domain-containing protein [Actinoplanes sp.]|nr:PilN domain-containing protein [Actinoplanes sp.]
MATTLMPLDPATSPQRAARVLPIVAHLLPEEVVAKRRAKKVRGIVGISLGVVIALLGSWYGVVTLQAYDAEDDLKAVTLEQTALQRRQLEYKDLTDTRAEIATISTRLASLLAEDLRWSTVFTTLRSTGRSSAVQITSVTGGLSTSTTATGGSATTPRLPSESAEKVVASLTVTGTAPDKNSIARYVDALEDVDIFANSYLTNATESGKTVQFSLSVDVTAAALGGRFSPTTAPTPAGSGSTGGN